MRESHFLQTTGGRPKNGLLFLSFQPFAISAPCLPFALPVAKPVNGYLSGHQISNPFPTN